MKKKLVVIIIVLILGLLGLGYYMYSNNGKGNNVDDARKVKYTIKYEDMGMPGNNYDISIYSNTDVKVVRHPGCSTLECIEGTYWPKDEEYEVKFDEQMKKKIETEYLPKIFAISNNIIVSAYDSSFSEETSKFLYAVIYKDDSNL